MGAGRAIARDLFPARPRHAQRSRRIGVVRGRARQRGSRAQMGSLTGTSPSSYCSRSSDALRQGRVPQKQDQEVIEMRIAQVAPLTEAVPPKFYGGTERVVHWLTEELVALGHDVTLFASGDSQTSAKLEATWPKALR